jgi:hypothetical protein
MSNQETETRPSWKITETTNVRIPLALLLTLLSVVGYAAVKWSGDHNAVADHTIQISEHEGRIKGLEASKAEIAVMQNDVRWIRATIEQQQLQQQLRDRSGR